MASVTASNSVAAAAGFARSSRFDAPYRVAAPGSPGSGAANRRAVRLAAPVEWDGEYGLHKISPLLDWSDKEVWDYIRRKRLPYNTLHDIGFPSIGCSPCTRAVQTGEDPRSGRWWWERADSRECGLHPRRKIAPLTALQVPESRS